MNLKSSRRDKKIDATLVNGQDNGKDQKGSTDDPSECLLEMKWPTTKPVEGFTLRANHPKRNILNAEEAQEFLGYARMMDHHLYYHWSFALFSGMTFEEINALRWSDVDMIFKTIKIDSSRNKKFGNGLQGPGETRVLPISSNLKFVLRELKESGPFGDKYCFEDEEMEYLYNNFVVPRVSKWLDLHKTHETLDFCATLGVPIVGFQGLRRTFVTNLLSRGVPKNLVTGLTRNKTKEEDGTTIASLKKLHRAMESLGYSIFDQEESLLVMEDPFGEDIEDDGKFNNDGDV